ncbi:MAG TPA: GAF domain-containing protein [Anaerolineales bacterium]|nr:GAF domain-containing protein [Anaerolineales bacterium]
MSENTALTLQLKEACKQSGARWAVWLERVQDAWQPCEQHNLTQARLKALVAYLQVVETAEWLAGTLGSQRVRSRSTGQHAQALGCQRLYAFPHATTHSLLLVGAQALDRQGEGMFRIVTLGSHSAMIVPPVIDDAEQGQASRAASSETKLADAHEPPVLPIEAGIEASYDPQAALERVLSFLARQIACQAAYLAIRSGETFHVQAAWNCPVEVQGTDISIGNDKPLASIVITRKGLLIEDTANFPLDRGFTLYAPLSSAGLLGSWMGLPVKIGQRIIGITAFTARQPGAFSASDLAKMGERVARLAYNIENAIIFGEVTHYLQQLALLNELASTASLGLDTDQGKPQDEFARRVMMRLRRTFKADWAAVLLLSPDGKTLQEYGGGSHLAPAWEVPVESSLMGLAVQKGLPVRIGDVHTATRYFPIHPDFRSELAVPLKYRGRIIGVLVLVSVQPNAFSRPDEQLLIVIASQMAGLFENMRLNEETRERAQKLADSVRQLEAVRDTSLDIAGDLDFDTLLSRLTIRARDLVGARGAELGLYNEHEQIVEVVISDAPWEHVQGSQIPLMAGVAGRLAAFGEPIVVDDYNTWPGRLLPHRKASFRAVAGVPLKFKGQVIGTLTVLDDRPDKTFKSEDVNLLELLAPQAAISIRNARLYQELQERIKAQQVAEARLVRSARLAAVGEMAAGVAHELNNPLTTVAGFAELILQDLEPGSPFREDLELVLAEAERARHVVRRLLDFSRPVEDQRTKTDLNELVKGVLLLVNHLTRTSNVKIVLELNENLPWVMLDPNQIKQVFLNLVHNALQAMPKGGKLTVTTGQEEHESGGRQQTWAILAVRDTGEGIPPENVEKLFEPFFSTRPPGKGTGLGLSVSYGIISSHGGFIDVESKPGQGSCFTIYLPQEMNGA